jgi:hypothetical protein
MKGITGFLVAAIALAVLGIIGLTASRIERHRADALQHIATLRYAEASESLDSAERYLAYGRWLPGIGAGALNDVRARKAALQYWQREYGALVPEGADPVAAVEEDNVSLQLVVANAAYRQGQAKQAKASDRQIAVQTLEQAAAGYQTVLKNSDVNEDAAFNYEYVVRLRDEAARGRRQSPPPEDKPEDGDLGQSGAPSEATSQKGFEIYIPLESEERPAGGDAGKAPGKDKKG